MGIRQSGNKRVFVVQPGRIYRIERSDVSGVRDLSEEAMTDSPKLARRIHDWIATI
jgi:hypothetical protein